MIQLHRLEGFYWVAKTGGYSKAARAFPYPITQPAVHQQVKKLEEELGLSLFERVSRDTMQPSPAGERLYEFIAPFFEGLPGLVRALSAGEYCGELRVLAQGLPLRDLLPSWLSRVYRSLPQLLVHLDEIRDFELGRLESGEVDIVVGYFPEIPDAVAYEEIATLYPFVVVPRGHPFARRKGLAWEALAGDTFISFSPGHLAHDLQHGVLAAQGIDPAHMISAGSAETILRFIEKGLGYSLLPSPDPSGPGRKGLVAREIPDASLRYPLYLCWRKDAPENPMLDAFLEAAPSSSSPSP